MLNQDTVREATRLTRGGRLVEATALLQRMLRNEREPGPTSRSAAQASVPRLEPPIIDAKADIVEKRESQQTSQAHTVWERKRTAAARGHATVFRARPARADHARSTVQVRYYAGGHAVHREQLQQRRRKPDLQTVHPKPLSGTAAPAARHASRLYQSAE